MNNILNFFRNLGLSADDKLLQKMGIESEKGVPTALGNALANELLFREKRQDVATLAKAYKDSKKKN